MKPRFANSPALKWFGHRLADDGIAAARDVRICWDCSRHDRVRNVSVFFIPYDVDALLNDDHPLWALQDSVTDLFQYNSGNCYKHWLSDDPSVLERARVVDPYLVNHTPDSLWRGLCVDGFVNSDEVNRAVSEFARIRECSWARDPSFSLPPIARVSDQEAADLLETELVTLPDDGDLTLTGEELAARLGVRTLGPFDERKLPRDTRKFKRCDGFMVPMEIWRQGSDAICEWMDAHPEKREIRR